MVEGRAEHAHDLGRFIIYDRPGTLVPQDGHGNPAGIGGIHGCVDLMQEAGMVDWVRNHTRRLVKRPAVLKHQPTDDRNVDHRLQALERAHYQRAVRPGAGKADIEMIAPRLSSKASLAVRPG